MSWRYIRHVSAWRRNLQTIVDDDKRGRVMSFYSIAFLGMAPFGSLLAGTLATKIGAPRTVMLTGSVCIAGAAWFTFRLPSIRQAVHPIYAGLGILPEVATGIQAATTLQTPPED